MKNWTNFKNNELSQCILVKRSITCNLECSKYLLCFFEGESRCLDEEAEDDEGTGRFEPPELPLVRVYSS